MQLLSFIFLFGAFLFTVNNAVEEGSPTLTDGPASISDSFTEDQRNELASTAESFSFQAEVTRLMDIIINSLYTQKEVFLRELISNAADALEKARFMAVTTPEFLGNLTELVIRVEVDPTLKTLTIQDTGIGMTREDLVNNLGTVARSGTTNFLEAMAESGDLNLIGQFGVGFYSAFLVADRVTVTSKNDYDPDQNIWESMIGGSFTIAKDPRGNTLGRGTRITLHLKDDSTEFLNTETVKQTILKFNQFVNFPIKLRVEKSVKKEENVEAEIDLKAEKESERDKKSNVEWEVINLQKPIWMRPRENVTDDEYVEFYRAIARDVDPAAYTHFSAEGEIEFKAIVYVPSHGSYNVWSSYYSTKQEAIKVYARRILVADAGHELLPKWLNFVKGVVDSDDLPLKVDRESFSQSRIVRVISQKLITKFLELMKKLSKEDTQAWEDYRKALNATETESKETAAEKPKRPETKYGKVWAAFSRNLKIGCVEDNVHAEKIVRISRFVSTHYGKDQLITLDEYISRMPETQSGIYYISNDDFDAAMNSPHMQLYKKKGIEVLVLSEPLDEGCFDLLQTYEGKRLISIEKLEPDSDESEDQKKRHKLIQSAFRPLTTAWSKALDKIVGSVRVTHKLVDAPAVISSTAFGTTAYGDRVAKGQMFKSAQVESEWSRRSLDINPSHPLIQTMLKLAKVSPDDPQLAEVSKVVCDAALFSSGYIVKDPVPLAKKLFKLLQNEVGVPQNATTEEYELSPEELNEAKKRTEKEAKADSSSSIAEADYDEYAGEESVAEDDTVRDEL